MINRTIDKAIAMIRLRAFRKGAIAGDQFQVDAHSVCINRTGRRDAIRIGNNVWVGERSAILKGVQIGESSVVACHGVVTKDVPPYTTVAGNLFCSMLVLRPAVGKARIVAVRNALMALAKLGTVLITSFITKNIAIIFAAYLILDGRKGRTGCFSACPLRKTDA